MTKVNCSVDSCEYWGKDQVCKAELIWVKNDITGDPKDFANHFVNASPVEFSAEFDQKTARKQEEADRPELHNGAARTSPQTCCDTMRPKTNQTK